MIIGIVGADDRKFSDTQEAWARRRILEVIKRDKPTHVVSGRCPKGGVDIWAIEEAKRVGLITAEFPAEKNVWEWYKKRNIQIAEACDKVVCIAVRRAPFMKSLPARTYKCVHCLKSGMPYTQHVQSGGCWTMHYARRLGKAWQLILIGG